MKQLLTIICIFTITLSSCWKNENKIWQSDKNINYNNTEVNWNQEDIGTWDQEGFISKWSGDGEFLSDESTTLKGGASIDESSISQDDPFNF